MLMDCWLNNSHFLVAGSIAQAAAAGLLKIPSSSVDVVDLTSDASKPDLPQKTIEGKMYTLDWNIQINCYTITTTLAAVAE